MAGLANMTNQINWIALNSGAKAPTRESGGVGLDLYATETISIPAAALAYKIDFGIVLSDDSANDYSAMFLHIRSSLAIKGLRLSNGVGVIEPHYSGFVDNATGKLYGVTALVDNVCLGGVLVSKGDRVAQLVVHDRKGQLAFPTGSRVLDYIDREDWEAHYESRRGGFGSTGN